MNAHSRSCDNSKRVWGLFYWTSVMAIHIRTWLFCCVFTILRWIWDSSLSWLYILQICRIRWNLQMSQVVKRDILKLEASFSSLLGLDVFCISCITTCGSWKQHFLELLLVVWLRKALVYMCCNVTWMNDTSEMRARVLTYNINHFSLVYYPSLNRKSLKRQANHFSFHMYLCNFISLGCLWCVKEKWLDAKLLRNDKVNWWTPVFSDCLCHQWKTHSPWLSLSWYAHNNLKFKKITARIRPLPPH